MSEYTKTISEYPNICFMDSPSRRNKNHSLLQLETANIIPNNYITEQVKKYKRVYTWNGKLFDEYKRKNIDVIKIPNFPLFDNYYSIDSFLPYKERVNGISLVCRYRGKQPCEFDITHMRADVFDKLDVEIKHCYGKIPYCAEHYKGVIGNSTAETYPSSKAKLEVISKYKFNLCFENAYHELWSWDYITEKITDCFKAKTVPVYWGCYNIEERIPKELYIDYREFEDTKELSEFLRNMNKSTFDQMVEDAFKWEKENKLGNIEELKRILDND